MLPVYRTVSVPKGFTFELPSAAVAWRIITGVMCRQPPGLYVHPDDPRTDEQIRKTVRSHA